jgi:protein gp37
MAKRLAGRYGYPKGEPFTPGIFHVDKLREPLHWGKPQKVFVCSMGDLFHENVGLAETDLIFTIISLFPQHTFMLLTKRPEIAKLILTAMHHNIWLGVTAENQRTADERIPILLQIPAAKHFVSVEPMLEKIDLKQWPYRNGLYENGQNRLDWVIAGPETGPKARPCSIDWVRDLYNQCKAGRIPFFDKKDVLGETIQEWPR